VLIWGTIWSHLDLLIVPGFAGTWSSQTCTFLACLAIMLATVSAATSLDRAALPRRAALAMIALGIGVGLIGIPAALIRSAVIDTVESLLGNFILADLAMVAACLGWAWRRGSAEARDLIIAWSVPMAALALSQLVDIGGALWGGGAQVLVLFAAAWQTLWLSIAATRRLARLRLERDRARAAEAFASELAARDPLTGLHNRRGFVKRVAHLIEQARAEDAPIALLLIDIDRFKAVNDAHGHEAGDTVLCTIAARLRRWESDSCAVARFGGEELAMMIVGIDGFALAQFAEGVRIEIAACDHRVAIGNHVVTASIGVAETREIGSFQRLYRIADAALYAAKRAGRDRVELLREAPVPERPAAIAEVTRARG
jgi:diguanylate cyclase (GGDEF)-like protein